MSDHLYNVPPTFSPNNYATGSSSPDLEQLALLEDDELDADDGMTFFLIAPYHFIHKTW